MPGLDTAVSAGLAIIPEIVRGFSGNAQEKEAARLAKTPRPPYQIAQTLLENRRLAGNRASQNLPGYGYLENQIDAKAGAGNYGVVQAGADPNSIISGIVGNEANAMDASAKLGYENAAYKDAGFNSLLGTNTALANEQKAQWQWDKQQPYLDAMKKAEELRNSGQINKFNAIDNIASVGVGLLGGNKNTGGASPYTYNPYGGDINPTAMTPNNYSDPYSIPNSMADKPIAPNSNAAADPHMQEMFGRMQQRYPNLTYDQFQNAYKQFQP